MKRVSSFVLAVALAFSMWIIPMEVYSATIDAKAGVVSISSGTLNIRSRASTSSSAVSSLRKGSYVTLLSKSGSWWNVEYAKGKTGYCHSDYISTVSGNTAMVNTVSTGLNVRSGAGTSHSKIGTVAKNEIVIVLSTSAGWSRILYHGTKTGYVSSQYLLSSHNSISLNLPNFKQTDSRWANVTIGSSGKTMSQIGCATTAVAMMESYRTGTTIYPDAMAKKLTYTASGSLYWPSNYIAVTNESGYLNAIYEKLKQGKPVLFGARTSAGKQHWVVVTGFTGGSAMTASQFKIHDPGSNFRTTLQQLLDVYPVFYKYFYY